MMDGDDLKDPNQLKDLKELVEFLKANEIAEFEVEREDLKLRLKFASAAPAAQAFLPRADMAETERQMTAAQEQIARMMSAQKQAADVVPVVAGAAEMKRHVVKSPIVGTFYEAPSPGSPPFVKVGDVVEVGQVLCIVEAMKLMNEIESDAAGEIVERIAVAGQPVEYGQALFAIKN